MIFLIFYAEPMRDLAVLNKKSLLAPFGFSRCASRLAYAENVGGIDQSGGLEYVQIVLSCAMNVEAVALSVLGRGSA